MWSQPLFFPDSRRCWRATLSDPEATEQEDEVRRALTTSDEERISRLHGSISPGAGYGPSGEENERDMRKEKDDSRIRNRDEG